MGGAEMDPLCAHEWHAVAHQPKTPAPTNSSGNVGVGQRSLRDYLVLIPYFSAVLILIPCFSKRNRDPGKGHEALLVVTCLWNYSDAWAVAHAWKLPSKPRKPVIMNRWNCQHDRGALSRKARGAGRRAGVLGWRAAGGGAAGGALRRLRAAHVWLLLELAAPIPRRGEAAVDAAARVVVVVGARAVEGVPEEVGQHELAALFHRAEARVDVVGEAGRGIHVIEASHRRDEGREDAGHLPGGEVRGDGGVWEGRRGEM